MESVFKEGVEVPPCVCEVSAFPFPRFLFLMKDLETKFVVLLRDLKKRIFCAAYRAVDFRDGPAPRLVGSLTS